MNSRLTLTPYNDGDSKAFRACYSDYSAELDTFMPGFETDLKTLFSVLESDADVHIHLMRIENEIAGFLIIGTGDNCHEDCDYYVQDFYVVPKFRRQLVGCSVVKEFTEKNPGTYCLRIITNNQPAQIFWKKTWEKIGAKDISNDLVDYTPEGYDFRAYDTRKADK